MLDSDTKQKIDALRNILVGKIPDPKGQVEQITTGMIYKFMHDMDQETLEQGGRASFFVGEFKKYSWTNLFNPKLSGVDKVSLYDEAIQKMYTNPTAPQLFREIFKNSYLPFRDPSTLNMFLKELNDFHYSHSEKLGDAYEYLLSFMGSQGKAGQFRTPRHIIDFIVEIVNPQKNETILDPACGTAGFLISSFKHILNQNTDKGLGDKLSAKERKQVSENLMGYDIDPNMTRISLVNMYLHQFANPQIHEYDTLSSEDRWNEYYDVILANPPFFSPKGGITPHQRFGVQSTRAEVLFVDYIMEHLKPNGRAGIVVPEGIIFQTGKAYKTLRKKLVEDCLVGVISLPAGVFQPYSGVKTSILILHKELNQKTDSIFFAKVENDGFSLGSQRREIFENDIPSVIDEITAYKNQNDCNLQLEHKRTVLAHKDVSLNNATYKVMELVNSDFELVQLGSKELFEVMSGGTPKSSEESYWNGDINWISLVDLPSSNLITQIQSSERTISELGLKNSSAKMIPVNSVIVSTRATIGRVGINRIPLSTNQGFKNIVIKDTNKVFCDFLAYIMTNLTEQMIDLASGGTFKEISKTNFEELSIPLPPIEIQKQIVEELERYQKIIDGCRQVVENYKPIIDIEPSWEMVELGEICEIKSGGTPKAGKEEYYKNGHIPWVRSGEVDGRFITEAKIKITQLGLDESSAKLFPPNSVLVAMYGATVGKVGMLGIEAAINQAVCAIFPNEQCLPKYLYYVLRSQKQKLIGLSVGSAQPNISQTIIQQFKIPLPSIEIQKQIVDHLNDLEKAVEGNKKLIEVYTQKIQDRIGKVWGEGNETPHKPSKEEMLDDIETGKNCSSSQHEME